MDKLQRGKHSNDLPPSANELSQIQRRVSPKRILAITIFGIAMAEVIAMIVVFYLRDWSYPLQTILDAVVMVIIIFPLLYSLSFKPLIKNIEQRNQSEQIIHTRLRLMQFASTNTLDQLLQMILNEIESLTDSTIGFFHFLDADQKTLWLQAWSTNTIQNMCKSDGKGSHYNVEQAGVWADCIRQKQPIIHNDYATLPERKGMPEEHAAIIRELVVPIMRNLNVVAVLGVGNKPHNYTANDVEIVSAIADFAWDIVENKRAETALRQSEEKFHTLMDWTYDWEMWFDPQGNLIYCSPSCERISGWPPEAFMADHDLRRQIIHPDDHQGFQEHHQTVHNETVGTSRIEYRIIARDGTERWVDHICRPIFDKDDRYLGRRVSNRDITNRKLAEQEIQKRNERENMLVQTIHTMQMDIARDLHDTIGQNVSYLRMKLDHLSEKRPQTQTEMDAEIKNMFGAASETYDLMRGTLALLNSENSTDLLELFRRYAEQISVRSTFEIDFAHYGKPRTLTANQMRHLFYVFREALSNIEKYANASQVSMEITWDDDYLVFVIFDNGLGFDTNQLESTGHYGIQSMQKRAAQLNGSLQIYSIPGSGTNIVLRMPY